MRRSSILAGLILIAVGVIFLLIPLFPNISDFLDISQFWPLIIFSIGILFLVGALLGSPGLAIPAAVIGGTGLMMYVQLINDAWGSWIYSWALIPVFVGTGIILKKAIEGDLLSGIRSGSRPIAVGLIIFLILGAIFGAGYGIGVGLALLLIVLGLRLAIRVILGRGERGAA